MKAEVFLDSNYPIALANRRDQLHDRARSLAVLVDSANVRVITTRAILFEIGSHFADRNGRSLGVQTLTALHSDPSVEIVEISATIYGSAFALYASRPDKDWSLVDCASFVVMQERGITDALTQDDHFTQAGFVALLR